MAFGASWTTHTSLACSLPFKENMDRICEHCGGSFVGSAYRVISEAKNITFLDMIVCSPCYMEAKRLRLRTEEIDLRGKQASARTRGSHSSRPEI